MATAVTILTDVLAKCGISYSSASIASTEEQVQEVVNLLNETGKDLAARGEWRLLMKNSLADVLPTTVSKIVSVIPSTSNYPARQITQREVFLAAQLATIDDDYYYWGETGLLVAGASASTTIVTYFSTIWSSSGGTTVTADGNEVYLPENCMVSGTYYRWLRKKGLPFDDVMAQHEAEVIEAQKRDRGVRE